MPFNSRAFRILIASPSDVEEEREITVRVIQEWNDLHADSRGVVLLPVRWETHSAPAYGIRPQEVINRAIVDQCDLLVGIFWTRIGSPTGVADSGTLEEIARVAKAGKPIMLYFSKMGMDPEQIDLTQLDKLKTFKASTYSNALIESYRSQVEFRDKFARQLELKVRDLQRDDSLGGPPPLSMAIASPDLKSVEGPKAARAVRLIIPTDVESALATDEKKAEQQRTGIDSFIKRAATVPIVLAIKNASASGVRNIYVELSITASEGVDVSDKEPRRPGSSLTSIFYSTTLWDDQFRWTGTDVEWAHEPLVEEGFKKTDRGWRITFEWAALQPNRTRFVPPPLFIRAEKKGTVKFVATVYADSLPEPVTLETQVDVDVHSESLPAIEILGPTAES